MPGIEVPPNTGRRFDVPAADISEALSQDGPSHGDAFQSKCGDFVRNAFIKLIESLGQGIVAFGTDMNSLVKTPRPTMVEFAPGDVPRFADIYNPSNPANTANPLPVQPKSQNGTRVWDYNLDGVAHDGMLADFVKDVRTAPTGQAMGGKDLVDNHLLRSADYFYRMWQKVEAQKRNVQ